MKKVILFSYLSMLPLISYAQLKVAADGNVGIKTNPDSTYTVNISSSTPRAINVFNGSTLGTTYAIHSLSYQTGASAIGYGVYSTVYSNGQNGRATAISGSSSTQQGGKSVGVYGSGTNTGNGVSYGVMGAFGALNSSNGAAVCGNAGITWPVLDGIYAGYFKGAVKVQGNLTVTGNISGTLLTSTSGTSIISSRQDEEGSTDLIDRLNKLSTNTYYIDMPTVACQSTPLSIEGSIEDPLDDNHIHDLGSVIGKPDGEVIERSNLDELSKMEAQIYFKRHYGLNADALEEVFPDLVYENEDGKKSINYVEMVPLLVQAINALTTEIKKLKGEMNNAREVKATNVADATEGVTILSLGQNKPNPFGETTSIAVSVPEDVQTAFLYVYNLNGSKLAQVDIPARGSTSVTLSAATLSEGMYLYSLVTDGKIVQTRRMIVEQ